MPFVEMDPELVFALIEGYEDVLTPAVNKLDAFYRQFVCPTCGGSCRKELQVNANGGHAFSDPDTPVARCVLRCQVCSTLFDPHTGILLQRGDGALTLPSVPGIGRQE